jgi:hypothetical protein
MVVSFASGLLDLNKISYIPSSHVTLGILLWYFSSKTQFLIPAICRYQKILHFIHLLTFLIDSLALIFFKIKIQKKKTNKMSELCERINHFYWSLNKKLMVVSFGAFFFLPEIGAAFFPMNSSASLNCLFFEYFL